MGSFNIYIFLDEMLASYYIYSLDVIESGLAFFIFFYFCGINFSAVNKSCGQFAFSFVWVVLQ